jgi:hypothetical protein
MVFLEERSELAEMSQLLVGAAGCTSQAAPQTTAKH